MGAHHVKGKHRPKARGRRPRSRICLRKGCGRKYQPRSWNQRYCQEPECQRQVRRWQAARRQAKHRQDDDARARHAQAERARRQRAKSVVPGRSTPRGCAGAWSRGRTFFSLPLCDRPGCHESPLTSIRNPARYCCPACRQAVRNVQDRERKWRCAAPWMAVRSEPTSTKPLASAGCGGDTTLLPRYRCGRLRRDDSPRRAGRQLSRGPWRLIYLGQPVHSQEPKHDSQTHSGSRATAASSHNRLRPPDLRDFDVEPSSGFRPRRRSSRRVADWCPDR